MPAIRRIRHGMGLALVDGIARLAKVDHVAVGLGDFGRMDISSNARPGAGARSSKAIGNTPAGRGRRCCRGSRRSVAWLDAHLPADFTPGLMHGDYHIGNVMFALDGPALAAIVDWELATLGDPLLDLGRLLAQWPEGDAPPPGGFRTTPHDGFPDMPEIIAHYAARTGRDMGSLRWHAVLASFKLGILLEGSNARAAAGKAPREIGDTLHGTAVDAWNGRVRVVLGGHRT